MEPAEQSVNNRKPVKGKGLDSEAARRGREDKGVQLRKDKRLDRANVERRKFKIEEDEDQKNNQSSHTRIRNLEILPKKCELLRSEDVTKQLEAAVYFRRILAADKFPPLDLVIETQQIVPTLVSFLKSYEAPMLQIEAAWSLTNIACGEARHIACLVGHNAIVELVKVVAATQNATLRDQALWALCNMSSDDAACAAMLRQPDILVPLLRQVGITCPPYSHAEPSAAFSGAHSLLGRHTQQEPQLTQFPMPDFPSLSTMRHIAFTCGNFARLRVQLSMREYQIIVYAFADLVQSPDEDIVLDVCNSLISLCEHRPECVPLLLEQGLLARMRECFELSALGDIALLVVCAIVRAPAPNNLAKVAALTHKPRAKPPLQYLVELLARTESAVAQKDVCAALTALMKVSAKYAQQSASYGVVGALHRVVTQGCAFDVKMEAGQCMCALLASAQFSLDHTMSNQASVVLCDLLSCTDCALLMAVLYALHCLFSAALANRVLVENHGDAADKVGLLAIHPYAEVSRAAQQLDTVLDKYEEAVGSDI